MLTCSRCGLAALVLLALAFTGCDTNNPGGRVLGDLEGVYTLEELVFTPETAALDPVDLGARISTEATTLEVFGNGDNALLRSRFAGGTTRRTDLEVRALSNAIEFTAVTADDEDELADLFLPRTFRLGFSSPRGTLLAADPDLFLSDVNLQAFDPDRYQGLTSVRGRLAIGFRRP